MSRMDILHGRDYDSREGKKTSWTKVGVAFPLKSGDGYSIKLEYIPAAATDGTYSFLMKPPMDRDTGTQERGGGRRGVPADLDDDSVPFAPAVV